MYVFEAVQACMLHNLNYTHPMQQLFFRMYSGLSTNQRSMVRSPACESFLRECKLHFLECGCVHGIQGTLNG